MIELIKVTKSYKNGSMELPVLNDINLNIEGGEFVAIMGPSGSGKSTLMNIMGFLDRATIGSYYFNGKNVNHSNDAELARLRNQKVGFIFQQFQLLSSHSALGNVELPLLYAGIKKGVRMARAKKALKDVGLEERIDYKPNQLSGGQKQRVAIARAMINRPAILLADEPTGALDSKSGRNIMDIFTNLNKQGVTIILVTHDQEIAKYAHRVINIRDGVIS